MKYIILTNKFFRKWAKKEIKEKDNNAKFENLFDGNFLVVTSKNISNLKFASNILKIIFETKMTNNFSTLKKEIIRNFKQRTLKIETLTYNTKIKSRELEVRLGKQLEDLGYKYDPKSKNVVAIVIFKEKAYLCKINTNYYYLNPAKTISRLKNKFNRAEFKLVEALKRFKIKIKEGSVLDIGAAPGGWSKVLAERGFKVYAVDPAELNKEIKKYKNIIHIKKKIEDSKFDKKVNLIVNDMNIDPVDTGRIINKLSKYLIKNGYAIVTLKIVKNNPNKAVELFSKEITNYKIEKIIHLFQNKRELTVLLRKN